jgi:phosphoribosylformylglycinamidine cyclo-ligase
MAVLHEVNISGIAHITGGGFYENMPRCLQASQGLKITQGSWTIPPIFTYMQELGNVPEKEMFNVFNMGIGMILVVDKDHVEKTLEILRQHGETANIIGEVTDTPGIEWA